MKRISILYSLSIIYLVTFSSQIVGQTYQNAAKSGLKSDTINVLNYDINLDIVHLSKKSIAGFTILTLVPKQPQINAIPVDLLNMTVDSVFVDNAKISTYQYNDTLLRIPLITPATSTDTVLVTVYYHGQPLKDPTGYGGFYFQNDSSYAYNMGVAFEFVPHTVGRIWFPCIDDFVDRATYDFHIRVKDSKMAVCNGTLMDTVKHNDATTTYYWRLHDEIPTYLASVAIGSYVNMSSTYAGINKNIPISLYVPVSDTAHTRASFVNLNSILSIFEQKFGPYRWEKVGYVAVPFEGGAMEHSTNIAYPLFALDGTLYYESLYGHELSHQWFGNLITCASVNDVWINEGGATYCEPIYKEILYGHDSFIQNVREDHFSTLSKAHIDDGGYYSLNAIPMDVTYGTTAYRKGADVMHTLRGYLGDSLFFSTIKELMDTFAFKPISSYQLRDFISTHSGVNVTDFFDGWVFSAGFPHFSIDSVVYTGSNNDYYVYVKQKLHQKPSFVNSNKVEVTFMSSNCQKHTETIEFSGQTGSKLCHLPFIPVTAMMDIDEKIADATTDYAEVVKNTGQTNYTNAFFTLDVLANPDSAFFRIEHNWLAPDPLKGSSPYISRMSNVHYWKVDGVFPETFNAKGRFKYNASPTGFDKALAPTTASLDSLVLLYRKDASDDWHQVVYTKSSTLPIGYLITDNLMKGEYVLGIGKPNQAGIADVPVKNQSVIVYPNPSSDTFNISIQTEKNADLFIYDSANKLVYSKKVSKGDKISWSPKQLKNGTYFIYVIEKGKPVSIKKVLFVR